MKLQRLFATSLALLIGALACAPNKFDAADLESKLASKDRAESDRARDATRRPVAVVEFLGIEPGMTVVDLIAASGYYSEVLAHAVGRKGKVYAQNNEYLLQMRDGVNEKAISARLADGRLPNVERLDREIVELGLEPGSVDAAVTALNFHDIYNARGPEAADTFLEVVFEILAPGGVLGIIDHAGGVGNDAELHRIKEELVIDAAVAAGFELDATSDLLRNPDDDRTTNVFDPAIRGRTDRFVLRLRKPLTAGAKD